MPRLVKANQATATKRRVYFHLVDATDGITAETGEAGGQPQISTNGAAFADAGIGVLVAIGNGRYYADPTQAAVLTTGDVIESRYKSAATAECPGDTLQIVAFDPDDAGDLGLSIIDMIEHQRGEHTVQGSIFYVDPDNGSDAASRGTRALPLATVQYAHDNYVTSFAHDCIILIAGNAAAITTLTEQVTISKHNLSIRGPGRGFLWNYGANGDVITVTGDGIELSGFRYATHSVGTGDGIQISGDYCCVRHTWCDGARSNAIEINDASWALIIDNVIEGAGANAASDGIKVAGAGTTENNHILRNDIFDTTGDGIDVSGAGVEHTIINGNHINDSSAYGIRIAAPASETHITGNEFHGNASGTVLDGGVNSAQMNNEQWAKHSIATETRLAELDAANLPADIDAILADVTGLNGEAMRGTDGANTTVPDVAGTAAALHATTDAGIAANLAAIAALNDPTANAIVAALKASTSWTEAGVVSYQTMLRVVYAFARGAIAKTDADLAYKDDGGTTLFTNRKSANARTPV